MKKFIVNLISYRFGIVLAAINLCYFAGKGFGLFDFLQNPSAKYFLSLNFPSLIAAGLLFKITHIFFPEISFEAQTNLKVSFFAFFIVVQWLSIGWLTKILAEKLRKVKF
jgi:hypothetical protein